MKTTLQLFLRFSLGFSFLSAVADRFGYWPDTVSVWGSWQPFVDYTQVVNPWFPEVLIEPIAIVVTIAEIVLGIGLIIGFHTKLLAKISGFLLLIFALSMTVSLGIKAPFDYSVFTASAAAFALSLLPNNKFEVYHPKQD